MLDNKMLKKDWESGMSLKELSEKYNYTESGILYRAKVLGLKKRKKKFNLPDDEIEKGRKLRAQGVSFTKLGVLFGISAYHARELFEVDGVDRFFCLKATHNPEEFVDFEYADHRKEKECGFYTDKNGKVWRDVTNAFLHANELL